MPLTIVVLLLGWGFYSLLRHTYHLWGWPSAAALGGVGCAAVFLLWKRTFSGMLAGLTRRNQASAALQAGDFERAETLLLEGLAQSASSSNKGSKGVLHWDLAELYLSLRRFEEAIVHLKAAVAVTTGDRSPFGTQIQECGPTRLLELYWDLQRWPDFEELSRQLIAISNPVGVTTLQLGLAAALMVQNRNPEALALAKEAEAAMAQLPEADVEDHLRALRTLAVAAFNSREAGICHQASERLLAKVNGLPRDHPGACVWEVQALCVSSQASILAGDATPALSYVHRALPKAKDLGDPAVQAQALYVLACALHLAGDDGSAREAANEAVQLWDSTDGDQSGRARTLLAQLSA